MRRSVQWSTPGRSGRARGAVVAALVAAASLLAPSAATAAPPTAGHPHRLVNRAPLAPTDLAVDPGGACAAGVAAPVRSTTPTLRVTLTDPDGDHVAPTTTVRDRGTGKVVWRTGMGTSQASGSSHAVQVPAGVLRDGRTYEWAVEPRDAHGRKGPVARCLLTVDVTAPGAVDVAPAPGSAPAAYAEDTTAGAVGLAGQFRFSASAADGVVAFEYAVAGVRDRVGVAAGEASATVSWTPALDGPTVLTVQAVDAAGNVGPERFYRFTVGSPVVELPSDARWRLDEGAGATAGSATPTGAGPTLTLSPSTTWTGGLMADLFGEDDDRALLLDEAGDGAASAGPLLDTASSYSVIAVVRADGTGAGTVVSQDGAGGPAFTLGQRTDGCPDGVISCWAFDVAGDGASEAVATSTVPVVPSAWVALVGIRDAATGTVRLDACSFGTADQPGDFRIVTGAAQPVGATPASSGPFRIGTASGGDAWSGAVGGLRTYAKAVGAPEERIVCSSGV
ncbi:LamG domain-containing protein [Cellulomonas fimi]|uniref:LamG-like jellyroll fold domain-containing protein n=1 Tax=Cellulomonas fimi TaxID=1708 RepID=UPI00234DE387|nr:LamG-like jellyroll fold domain-containing protein [Cellulomonas fimi]MDC7121919.1 LamG domain-containing protein [Cellulomonas fimi]